MARIIQTAEIDLARLTDPDLAHWIYNGLDCCITAEVYQNLRQNCDNATLSTYEFSKSLQAPVAEMSMRGLLVNKRRRMSVVREMKSKLARLEEQLDYLIREGVGIPNLNWRSPTQLKHLLYDIMQLPVQKKRNQAGKYAPSVDREALEKLSVYFIAEPICNHLMAMRDLGKSIGFLETGIDLDGRMRANFNIAGTDTGRFSSNVTDFGTGTNLQNVTSSLRSVFVADPGMKFANLDLEQADSRNVGALVWDLLAYKDERKASAYLDACESGDLHTFVCRMANPDLGWGGDLSDRALADQIAYRGKTYRDLAKVLGHGSNYLGTPPTMSRHSKLPISLVKNFQANYFGAFPGIVEWHDSVKYNLLHLSHVTTPFGRRRFFFGRPGEGTTQRAAVAYAPQSMTADEINLGILRLWRANKVQLLVQVHDSILFQYPEEQEDEIIPWALETLKTHIELSKGRPFHVPTEAMTGWNWGYHSEDNPDGLKKWKGSDSRKRTEVEFQLSLAGL